jgi:hypothetical protein
VLHNKDFRDIDTKLDISEAVNAKSCNITLYTSFKIVRNVVPPAIQLLAICYRDLHVLWTDID